MANLLSEGRWVPYEHLLVLNRKLIEVETGACKRLIVQMPPRHGKSELISRWFPAWYLGRHPDHRVILASYAGDFAAEWGRKVRDVLEEHGPPLFGVSVRGDSRAADRWDIEGRYGGMATAGVGGSIMGKGADMLIVDDYVKSDAEAMSRQHRDKTWDWFLATASTRLHRDAAAVVFATRWHSDDLIGRILAASAAGGEHWDIVDMPAAAERDEEWPGGWRRGTGEALCPELFPSPKLREIETRIGSWWWSCLYQQRPKPAGGGVFKEQWLRHYRVTVDGMIDCAVPGVPVLNPMALIRFATVDLATRENESADYTAIAMWAYWAERNLLFLVDVDRRRMEGPAIIAALQSMRDKWHPAFFAVETVQAQLYILQFARPKGVPVREIRPDRDKLSRALSATTLFEAARVWFPERAPWLADCEGELLSFNRAEHDDFVDCVSYAAAVVMGGDFLGGSRRPGEFEAPRGTGDDDRDGKYRGEETPSPSPVFEWADVSLMKP